MSASRSLVHAAASDCAVSVARARSRVSRLWASRNRAHSRWSSPSLPSAASRRRDSWETWEGVGGEGEEKGGDELGEGKGMKRCAK